MFNICDRENIEGFRCYSFQIETGYKLIKELFNIIGNIKIKFWLHQQPGCCMLLHLCEFTWGIDYKRIIHNKATMYHSGGYEFSETFEISVLDILDNTQNIILDKQQKDIGIKKINSLFAQYLLYNEDSPLCVMNGLPYILTIDSTEHKYNYFSLWHLIPEIKKEIRTSKFTDRCEHIPDNMKSKCLTLFSRTNPNSDELVKGWMFPNPFYMP